MNVNHSLHPPPPPLYTPQKALQILWKLWGKPAEALRRRKSRVATDWHHHRWRTDRVRGTLEILLLLHFRVYERNKWELGPVLPLVLSWLGFKEWSGRSSRWWAGGGGWGGAAAAEKPTIQLWLKECKFEFYYIWNETRERESEETKRTKPNARNNQRLIKYGNLMGARYYFKLCWLAGECWVNSGEYKLMMTMWLKGGFKRVKYSWN